MMRSAANMTQTKFLPENNIYMLWDPQFEDSVDKELVKLNPICTYIDYVQSRNCTLADSVDKWLQIDWILGYFDKWTKRNDMICDLPSLIAYSLHPIYKGTRLTAPQKVRVKTTIHRLGEETYSEYEKFMNNEDQFGDKEVLKLKPETYWKIMQFEYPKIAKLALSYLPLPASTASLERVFSMWAFIHNKSRNKLSSETSEKLIYIYHALKTMKIENLMKLY